MIDIAENVQYSKLPFANGQARGDWRQFWNWSVRQELKALSRRLPTRTPIAICWHLER